MDGVLIVGGGLCGALTAATLAARGVPVTVRERRTDLRSRDAESGRSINLVLTARGIEALRRLGLDRDVLDFTVPVWGRMMHDLDGALAYQPYGRDETECNYSVSRAELNRFLLDAAEARGARVIFGSPLVDADFDAGRLLFRTDAGDEAVDAPAVIGADGVASVVRRILSARPAFEERVELLEHGYKELEIPAAPDGGFRLDPKALHIWPRGHLMLMALPNPDATFTVTLYLPLEGEDGFDRLDGPRAVHGFFERHFPDAIDVIPDLETDFFENPTGTLGTVRAAPWNLDGRVVMIGDAAHGIVPFFGQGMNAAFEDCTVVGELLDAHGPHWERVFPELYDRRKPDTDAIAEMALDNFVEMRDRVGDERFLLRKAIERRLERALRGEYRSRYAMVTYTLIPYRVARAAGEVQEEILEELARGIDSADEVDLDRARELVRARLTPLLERHGVRLAP